MGEEENIDGKVDPEVFTFLNTEEADILEKGRVRLYRDILHIRNNSASPAIIINGSSNPVYLPNSFSLADYEEYADSVSEAIYFSTLHGNRVKCPRCLTTLFSFWENEQPGARVMADHIGNQDRLQEMRKSFSSSHIKWRKKFLELDGRKCRACGSTKELELAHITSVEDFFYSYRKGRRLRFPMAKYLGVEHSYRDDNLVMLCSRCHDAQTMNWGIHQALENPVEFLEMLHRRHEVLGMFEKTIEKRGWRTAENLNQKTLF